jgi:hypothetical protein
LQRLANLRELGVVGRTARLVDVQHVEPAAIGQCQAQRVFEGRDALRREVGRMGD